jgi:hypothetical protein
MRPQADAAAGTSAPGRVTAPAFSYNCCSPMEVFVSISMYDVAVPPLTKSLESLSKILVKAEEHAQAKKFDPGVLFQARLAPDMFPLARQVQIASDTAKGCAARLAGQEPPSFPDNEATLAELAGRLKATADFMLNVPREQIDGSENRSITLKMRTGPLHFSGVSYLLEFVLPNFYFHVTTAYAILRHNGVELGKRDYLGQT